MKLLILCDTDTEAQDLLKAAGYTLQPNSKPEAVDNVTPIKPPPKKRGRKPKPIVAPAPFQKQSTIVQADEVLPIKKYLLEDGHTMAEAMAITERSRNTIQRILEGEYDHLLTRTGKKPRKNRFFTP